MGRFRKSVGLPEYVPLWEFKGGGDAAGVQSNLIVRVVLLIAGHSVLFVFIYFFSSRKAMRSMWTKQIALQKL